MDVMPTKGVLAAMFCLDLYIQNPLVNSSLQLISDIQLH